MVWFVLWVVLVIVAGIIANNKGRSVLGWVLLSALVAPITILILLALPPLRAPAPMAVQVVNAPAQSWAPPPPPLPSDTKACPRCAETIKRAALICRFCQYDFAAKPSARGGDQEAGQTSPERPRLSEESRLALSALSSSPNKAATEPPRFSTEVQALVLRMEAGGYRVDRVDGEWRIAALGGRGFYACRNESEIIDRAKTLGLV